MIIPFFIPHAGCPHQCVFCNQKNITGRGRPLPAADVAATIDRCLARRNFTSIDLSVQVAFYGGSFTGLPPDTQEEYLKAVRPFIESGRISNIRLSTRPDCINGKGLDLLRRYHVKTVELGVQSMDDRVLALAGRGHTAAATENAVALLREHRFDVGVQLMPGLPGDSADLFRATVLRIIALKPDFVRLYPALVIKGTPLEQLYRTGAYDPLSLDAAVSICRAAQVSFSRADIPVIRMGLQPTEELERPGTILAGPYHPAFRQLVESSIFLDKMRVLLREGRAANSAPVFCVNRRDVSAAVGQRRENIVRLKKEFGLAEVRIVEGKLNAGKGEVILLSA
jgi:histone acetyltransferase (RNA polymerase elongator complex component)